MNACPELLQPPQPLAITLAPSLNSEIELAIRNLISITVLHGLGVARVLDHTERRFIEHLLARHRGNQCAVASEAGMHRNTLRRKLSDWGAV